MPTPPAAPGADHPTEATERPSRTQSARKRQRKRTIAIRLLLLFPALVPERFTELVSTNQPRALAVLAYFFAFFARFRDVWWIGPIGVREVKAIAEVLRGTMWEEEVGRLAKQVEGLHEEGEEV